jgi:hypothetical protein
MTEPEVCSKIQEGKKVSEAPNFQKRMAKAAQVLSNLNENLFACEPSVRFDFAAKKFCGSSLAFRAQLLKTLKKAV